jgi:hypothetical protein
MLYYNVYQMIWSFGMSAHLTAKQNAFALGIVDGIPATTAYRQAYDADGMKPESVWVESCRLATNPKVALTGC